MSSPYKFDDGKDLFPNCTVCSGIIMYQAGIRMQRRGQTTAGTPESWLSPEAKKVMENKPEVYAYWLRRY